jgi:hypothetical protein
LTAGYVSTTSVGAVVTLRSHPPWDIAFGALCAAGVGLIAVCCLRLVAVFRNQPAERLRSSGLLACLAAVAALALAVGWGRGGIFADDPGSILLAIRYVTLTVPLVCCLYLIGILYGKRWVSALLCAVLALMLPVNTATGLARGRERARLLAAVEADVRAGVSPQQLGRKYAPQLFFDPDLLAQRFEMLRKARQGPYKGMPRE